MLQCYKTTKPNCLDYCRNAWYLYKLKHSNNSTEHCLRSLSGHFMDTTCICLVLGQRLSVTSYVCRAGFNPSRNQSTFTLLLNSEVPRMLKYNSCFDKLEIIYNVQHMYNRTTQSVIIFDARGVFLVGCPKLQYMQDTLI